MAEININHWLHFSGTRAADEIILDGILIHLQFILYLILFRILRRSFIQSEWRQVPPLSNSSDLFSEHATIILIELFIHLLKWNRNLGLKNSCNFLYCSNLYRLVNQASQTCAVTPIQPPSLWNKPGWQVIGTGQNRLACFVDLP